MAISRVIITADEIKREVVVMAERICEVYREKDLLVIGILDGSLVFLCDLLSYLPFETELRLVKVSSYVGTERFEIKMLGFDVGVKDRDVLVVDDIVDTGKTLQQICDLVLLEHPKSLRTATLLRRLRKGKPQHISPPDFVGFELDCSEFFVGYGLDFMGRYRGLPYIAAWENS